MDAMPQYWWIIFTLLLAVTFLVRSFEATATEPAKLDCDKPEREEPETLCEAAVNCYCYRGTFLDITCDTFDEDTIDCSVHCQSCPDDTFTPYDNRCLSCRNVTECRPNEQVKTEATRATDQVCECRPYDLTCPPCPTEQTTIPDSFSTATTQGTDKPTPKPRQTPDQCHSGGSLAVLFFAGLVVGILTNIYHYRKKCYRCLSQCCSILRCRGNNEADEAQDQSHLLVGSIFIHQPEERIDRVVNDQVELLYKVSDSTLSVNFFKDGEQCTDFTGILRKPDGTWIVTIECRSPGQMKFYAKCQGAQSAETCIDVKEA